MEIAIIGAGPAGCYAGYLLSKSGHAVTIYEKKPEIGLPIQCTGLLTADFDEFGINLKNSLVNTFEKLEVNSPNGNRLEVEQKEYLICRKRFDNLLADLAKKSGAKILLEHSFAGKDKGKLIIKDKKNKNEVRVSPDLVIAADGPLSPTAKAFGLYCRGRKNYLGIQATVTGSFDKTKYLTYFGEETCPDAFAWIVPESSDTARVGLAATKDTREYFDNFIGINKFKVEEKLAAIIPVYDPKQKMNKDNCYLLGDAAGFVKATTLGGIIPGMKQAEILAYCINNGKNYEKELKPLKKRLKMHLTLRKIMGKFSDKDWNLLVSYMNQVLVKDVLRQHTRENPVPLVRKALMREPRFLYFLKYLF
ncbi:MAG: NAD(P)/FAD-dependent oxidoreductase [Nanoarchaeota archaeon]|nr:NAD(P)/FAD-dependent oxidoreductase [Nanoarchaeota archaeon]MBU1643812.1 NAD(P)/FAD-dependent oxidoreductase [Nanoarchaeota archaeon]